MGCCSTKFSRGLSATEDKQSVPAGCSGCNKLNVHDWLNDLPKSETTTDLVEIRFKNTRKSFFRNVNSLHLQIGDVVAVEASPGHDIGIVSLSGDLVTEKIQKTKRYDNYEYRKVYRKAKLADIEKWEAAMEREDPIMFNARKIASSLGLQMKIGDVEFQGDGTKAIFYYIADDRVDFRELIKMLADQFRIRVEMKQIGARQEAGRIGGIGSCGRELCCATWMTNFVSVTTNSARTQELTLNPQKLAGQCGKLKCCLNYELDSYEDEKADFPSTEISLETEAGRAYHFKTDTFKRIMWYSYERYAAVNVTAVDVDRVKEVIAMNRKNEKPETLGGLNLEADKAAAPLDFANVVGQDSLTRFENVEKKNKRRKGRKPIGRTGARVEGENPRTPKTQQNNRPTTNKQQGNKPTVRKPVNKRMGTKPDANRNTPRPKQNPNQKGNPNAKETPGTKPNTNRKRRLPRKPNKGGTPDKSE